MWKVLPSPMMRIMGRESQSGSKTKTFGREVATRVYNERSCLSVIFALCMRPNLQIPRCTCDPLHINITRSGPVTAIPGSRKSQHHYLQRMLQRLRTLLLPSKLPAKALLAHPCLRPSQTSSTQETTESYLNLTRDGAAVRQNVCHLRKATLVDRLCWVLSTV